MPQRLKSLKLKAANRKDCLCCYCEMPMWHDDMDQFVIR